MTTVGDFLGAEPAGDGRWTFRLGRELHGAFGGAFGGAVAAAMLVAARPEAPDRLPAALDCHFLRGLSAGTATALTSVVHSGRTLASVDVRLHDDTGRLAARAALTFVAADALEALDHAGTAGAGPDAYGLDELPAWRVPEGVEAPIVATLRPRLLGEHHGGIVTAVRVPWDEPGASAEAVCMAADMCVGPPVGGAFDRWIPHPNPDLSLRFAGEVTTPDLVATGRLERIARGVAAVRVEVRSGDAVVGIGVSSSTLLGARG